jgi:hypothetical protein
MNRTLVALRVGLALGTGVTVLVDDELRHELRAA